MGVLESMLWSAAEATALAVAVLAGSRLHRPAAPLRHALWLLVLAKLLLPPLAVGPFGLGRVRALAVETARSWVSGAPREQAPTALRHAPALAPERPAAGEDIDAGWEEVPARMDLDPDAPLAIDEDPAAAALAMEEPVGPPEAAATPGATPSQPLAGVAALAGRLAPPAALAVWLGVALALLASRTARIVRFDRAVRRASRPAPPEARAEAARIAARLGLRRLPEVLAVAGGIPPLLWAPGKPRVLIPEALLEPGAGEALRAALAHELAHVRRRDHWTAWIELLAGCLWWWLPPVAWARREMGTAADEAADAWAVWALGDRKTYAKSLLEAVAVAAAGPWPAPACGRALGERDAIQRRLTMIMRNRLDQRLSPPSLALVALAGLLVLPGAPDRTAAQDVPGGASAPAPAVGAEPAPVPVPPPPPQPPGAPAAPAVTAAPPAPLPPPVVLPAAPVPAPAGLALPAEEPEVNGRPATPSAAPPTTRRPVARTMRIRGDGKTVELREDGNVIRAEEIVLEGPGMAATGYGAAGAAGTEGRLDALERKMEAILRELSELRRTGMGGSGGGGGAIGAAPSGRYAPGGMAGAGTGGGFAGPPAPTSRPETGARAVLRGDDGRTEAVAGRRRARVSASAPRAESLQPLPADRQRALDELNRAFEARMEALRAEHREAVRRLIEGAEENAAPEAAPSTH